ncbi:MAG TPA: hypothetical protein VL172_13690, partial [Kofleriaceae bacterium]|nr:hypothetical protein [Kofleriaceae bacterium]
MAPLRAPLAVALAAALAGPAAAQPRVAVIGQRAAEAPATAAQVRDAVAAALGEGAVSDPFGRARASLDAGAVPEGRLEPFRRATQLVEEGWRAYLAVQKTFARDRLGEARHVAEEVLDLEGGRELYAEVSLRLGLVLLDLGEGGEAADLFRLVRALDPEREIGTAEFHPDVVRASGAAAAATVPAQRVVIDTEPGGAPAAVE